MPITYGPYPNSKGQSTTYTFVNDKKQPVEYILVSDNKSEVLLSTESQDEAQKLATKIRAAGGAVTIFMSTKL